MDNAIFFVETKLLFFLIMSEQLLYNRTDNKSQLYEQIMPQVEALMSAESDVIANMANMSAVLREVFDFFWVGFYIVRDTQLVLGPFQGPLACTRIAYGKGVCGTAWATQQTQLVRNVDEFPGHIACSSQSKSEIVVPIIEGGQVVAVLDVDSDKLADFDDVDAHYLTKMVSFLKINP